MLGELSPAATPGRDGSVDVGLDAGGDVGGGVEQPLQPDPVQHGGDQAYFYPDLGQSEWCHIAGIDRLLRPRLLRWAVMTSGSRRK